MGPPCCPLWNGECCISQVRIVFTILFHCNLKAKFQKVQLRGLRFTSCYWNYEVPSVIYCTVNYTGNLQKLVTRCGRGRNNCKNLSETSHKKGHQVANLKSSEKQIRFHYKSGLKTQEMSGQYCNSIILELRKAFSTTFHFEQSGVKSTEMLAHKYLLHYLNLPIKRRWWNRRTFWISASFSVIKIIEPVLLAAVIWTMAKTCICIKSHLLTLIPVRIISPLAKTKEPSSVTCSQIKA